VIRKDSVAGIKDRTKPSRNVRGCSDWKFELEGLLFPTELIIKDIPQGENEETTPFARSQKSSFARSILPFAEPVATAHATQKIQLDRIREKTRKLLLELRLGLFENAAAPTPATNTDKAYKIIEFTSREASIACASLGCFLVESCGSRNGSNRLNYPEFRV